MLGPQRAACFFSSVWLWSVSVECGAWPAHWYNWSHFQIELRSNIVLWSFGLDTVVSIWIPSSRCLVSQNEHYFMFWSLFCILASGFEGHHTWWFLSFYMSVINWGHIGAFFARFYDPNTLLLLRLFLSYHSVWGHPSFRLSHDQQDLAFPNQMQINLWGKRLIGKTKSSANILLLVIWINWQFPILKFNKLSVWFCTLMWAVYFWMWTGWYRIHSK